MEEQQDLTKFIRILKRRKWSFILILFSVITASLIITLVLSNLFMSSATILIENQTIPQAFVSSPVTSYAGQRIQTITQEIMSRSRILSIIRKYDLLPKKRKHLTTDTLIEKVRKRIIINPINVEVHHQTQNRPILLTIAFSLSFQDEDPKKAQAVTNEISSYYLEKNLESREKHIQNTTKFLDAQLKETKDELDDYQTKLARFRKEHLEELPEFMTFNMKKIDKLNDELRNMNIEIRSLEQQRILLKNQIMLLNPYGSERIITPEERLLQLRLERVQLLSKYSEDHPSVMEKNREIFILEEKTQNVALPGQIQDRLKELEMQIIDLRSNYSLQHPLVKGVLKEIESLQNDLNEYQKDVETSVHEEDQAATNPAYVSLKSQLDRIEVSIASLEEEKLEIEQMIEDIYEKLRTMPSVGKRFNELDRDYQSAKMHYYEIMEKLLSARISQGMEEKQLGERFTVVEPAFFPDKPYKPNRILIIVLGTILGLGLSIGFVSLREYTDDHVRESESLEKLAEIPVLVSVSTMKTAKEISREKRRRILLTFMIPCVLIIVSIVVHHYFIDCYVLYVRVARFLKSRFIF